MAVWFLMWPVLSMSVDKGIAGSDSLQAKPPKGVWHHCITIAMHTQSITVYEHTWHVLGSVVEGVAINSRTNLLSLVKSA